ncbi:probable E3 ubiquitin-protein ligase XERICO [Phragmites australis]|uniref:probable E3 ubiquitin-protein ligase XERICO n=1 Tax=Phragmites australis TaxID=29695 RepID=UPI002D76783D|nr:probable E3 ubiquitin-protein ligase XERICO [Phragmites australis]
MGISSMPAPRDSLMAYLLYNTVVSIAALAGLVRAALVFLDLQAAAPPSLRSGEGADGGDRLAAPGPGPGLAERFRSGFTPARFVQTTRDAAADCRVCLARFEPEAVVNRLPCGHLFHRGCLETWLLYDRATCPLCRARLLPAADEPPPALRLVEFE